VIILTRVTKFSGLGVYTVIIDLEQVQYQLPHVHKFLILFLFMGVFCVVLYFQIKTRLGHSRLALPERTPTAESGGLDLFSAPPFIWLTAAHAIQSTTSSSTASFVHIKYYSHSFVR
jgi:hypothetical protein